MIKLTLIIILSLSAQVYAGVINPGAKFFKKTGEVSSFKWAPERYENDFRYDVLYYIPEKLKDTEKVKTIVFMHGGGASTNSARGSLRVAKSYMDSTLVHLADQLQMVVVVPSANGLNWGGHTSTMLVDLNRLMRKDLSVDHNNMGLSGHSMGAMGIGRNYFLVTDEFSYLVPMAGGIEEHRLTEENMTKTFNIPYVHLQGKKDHFQIFIERCEEQMRRTLVMEKKFKQKSKLEIIYYDGTHNHDFFLMRDTIARLQKSPRNIFQPKLFGTLYHDGLFRTENKIRFNRGHNPRYFWVEIKDANGEPERIDFIATIENNKIKIDLKQYPNVICTIRVRLSKKMLNPKKPVELIVNGKSYEKRMMKDRPYTNPVDPEFSFDDHIDISF